MTNLHEFQTEQLCVAETLQLAPSPDIGLQQVPLILGGHALQHCPHVICCLKGVGVQLDDCMRNSLPSHPAICVGHLMNAWEHILLPSCTAMPPMVDTLFCPKRYCCQTDDGARDPVPQHPALYRLPTPTSVLRREAWLCCHCIKQHTHCIRQHSAQAQSGSAICLKCCLLAP